MIRKIKTMEEIKAWHESEEGHKALKEMFEETDRQLKKMRKLRKIDPKILDIHMTI